MHISRREAIHRLSILVGGAISAPTMGAILSGCRAEPPLPTWTPEALSTDQVDLLGVVVDRIIPATDTPGAREAGVPAFIDRVLADWLEPEDRERFLEELAAFEEGARTELGVSFAEAGAEQQDALLARLDAEGVAARENGEDPLPFFAYLKEVTVVGYYTSEIGATQELQWLAVPGRYDADLPLEEVGRTWA